MKLVAILAICAAVFLIGIAASTADAADRGKVKRFWDRQMHTGGVVQLLDYRILRCGPSGCVVRWHLRAFTPGDEQDFGGFNEYKGDDFCKVGVTVACDMREPTVRWVAAGGNQTR